MSYLRRRYILLEKLQDSLRGSGEGGESGLNKNASCKQRGKSGGFVDPMEKNSSIQYSKLLLEVSV